MILQALCEYYQRKAMDPDGGIAPEGFEWKPIPFLVVVDQAGALVTLQDTREGEGRHRQAKAFLIPRTEKRTVGIKANLLWDNVEYTLGANPKARPGVQQRHQSFRDRLDTLAPHPDLEAVKRFLDQDPLSQIAARADLAALWAEVLESGGNLTFRVEGSPQASLCEAMAPQVAEAVGTGVPDGICLVTGRKATIARLHASVAGVRGAQSAGAALVSFNLPAFSSHGRTQNHNAPVGESAAFAYTTALNRLLGRDSRHKVQVGDATTVFWSGNQATRLESDFPALFGLPAKDNPDAEPEAVRALYATVRSGQAVAGDETPFFVLGLAPNAARLSVRFWHQDTVGGMSTRLRQYLDDLDMVCSPRDPGRRALMPLLCDLVLQGKADNIPPNLAGQVMRAALSGGPYPQALLQLAVRRIRAERQVTRMRAAVLKAVLNRSQQHAAIPSKEITVSLDPTNPSPGYRLGRLFAILEKIQEDAQPGINTTIRDRFYGAASSTPATVFPQLLKLKNHHLAKLDNPAFRRSYEIRLGEVFDGLQTIPSHLPMEEQARFAIGYYHQRQSLFTKVAKPEPQA
jgi:CRISPR-associated protein Csd1